MRDDGATSTPVGRVLGSDPAHPLEFWVGVDEENYLQLDDIIAVSTYIPNDDEPVTVYGIVDEVRSRFEGDRFDSDVFRVAEGILPIGISNAAHVRVTRNAREIYVAPKPGDLAYRAVGEALAKALYFDGMRHTFKMGLSRQGDPLLGNLDFLDGTRGAHMNISGISGVATKTTYAVFLLHSLFNSDALDRLGPNSRAIIFNVKGEDLLHLDKENVEVQDPLDEDTNKKYQALNLPMSPFRDVAFWAPVYDGVGPPVPDVASRDKNEVTAFFWSIRRFCEEELLPFLFAEADRETGQLQFAITVATNYLKRLTRQSTAPKGAGWIRIDQTRITSLEDLIDFIDERSADIFDERTRIATATVHAFIRRLRAAGRAADCLVRKTDSTEEEDEHLLTWDNKQVNVIHVGGLHDTAMRFVVGVTLKRLMEAKQNRRDPVVFVVLDELNKYAPRERWSPIKEIVLDIAERGRSLGLILIGAQQTASEVERRVVANASFRVVGRLDVSEAQRTEYGFLSGPARDRASILKPGSMFVLQPEIPVPLLVEFPKPAWATRKDETAYSEDSGPKWR